MFLNCISFCTRRICCIKLHFIYLSVLSALKHKSKKPISALNWKEQAKLSDSLLVSGRERHYCSLNISLDSVDFLMMKSPEPSLHLLVQREMVVITKLLHVKETSGTNLEQLLSPETQQISISISQGFFSGAWCLSDSINMFTFLFRSTIFWSLVKQITFCSQTQACLHRQQNQLSGQNCNADENKSEKKCKL